MTEQQIDYPALELEREFPPDFLRQIPDQLTMVPHLLRCLNGRPYLELMKNGRGEEYWILRIYSPLRPGKEGLQTRHYLGQLGQKQLAFLKRLVIEYDSKRQRTGPEQLRRDRQWITQMEETSNEAMELARDCAKRAGFTFRGYMLHRQSETGGNSVNNLSTLDPQEAAVDEKTNGITVASVNDVIGEDPRAYVREVLATIRAQASADPLRALEDALFMVKALTGQIAQLLGQALHASAIERMLQIANQGSCRALTKAESRALARLRRRQSSLRLTEKSLAKLRNYRREQEVAA